MSTTKIDIKIGAETRDVATGMKPLLKSMGDAQKAAADTEKSLKDLGKTEVKVNVEDKQVTAVKDEIARLRRSMRESLAIDVNADVREPQRRIAALQRTLRTLDQKDVDVDVDIDVDESKLRRLDRIKDSFQDIRQVGGKVAPVLQAIGTALSAATLGLSGIAIGAGGGVVEALKLSDQLDNAKIAFEQFLGSGKKADKFLQDLSDFAAKTPFSFPELVESSKQLLAYGVQADDVIDTLTTLGDTAGIVGSPVSDLTEIWGQMLSAGTLANEDLKQFQQRGVDVYGMIAKHLGVSVAEVKKLSSEHKLMSSRIMPVLERQMNKTFGGGMAKQAETLSGKISTLKDTLAGFGRDIGDALTPAVSAIVDELQPALEDLGQWVKEHKASIAINLSAGLNAFLKTGAEVIDFFATLFDVGAQFENMWGGTIEAIGKGMQAMQGLPGVADDFGNSVVKIGQGIQGNAASFKEGAKHAHEFADGMRDVADKALLAAVRATRKNVIDELDAKIDKTKKHLQELQEKPPTAKVQVQIDDAMAKLDKLQEKRKNLVRGQALVEVNANVESASTKLKRINAALKNLKSQKPTPKIEADIAEWERKKRKVQEDLRRFREQRTKLQLKLGIDPASKQKTEKEIAHLSRNRTVNLYVKTTVLGKKQPGRVGTGGGLLPGLSRRSVAPESIVGPTEGERTQLLAAGAALTATPLTGGGGGTTPSLGTVVVSVPGGEPAAPAPTQLAPKQTPIQVLLDGAVIADHLGAHAQRLAVASSVGRVP